MKKSKDTVIVNNTLVSLFRLYDTTGLPVDMAMHLLKEKGLNASVPHFIVDVRKAGWGENKIATLLNQVCKDLQLSMPTLDSFLKLPPASLEKIVLEWSAKNSLGKI